MLRIAIADNLIPFIPSVKQGVNKLKNLESRSTLNTLGNELIMPYMRPNNWEKVVSVFQLSL